MLNSNALEELSLKADAFLIAHDNEKLKMFLQSLLDIDYKFENLVDEARFYYILGNCSLELFSFQKLVFQLMKNCISKAASKLI